ncbi:MAG: hypothetical protein ACRDJL_09565 [Actinomycetota bacterium]
MSATPTQIPPLVGFGAKLALFIAAIEADYEWLAIVAAINTVVSIFYYARVMAPAYFDDIQRPFPCSAGGRHRLPIH